MGRFKNLEGKMRKFYKIIMPVFLMLVIVSGCEKKQEEVHPTETTTTIIEVDKKDKNKTGADTNDESIKEENEESNDN